MSEFWLDSPSYLFNFDLNSFNGTLNLVTLVTVLITVVLYMFNVKDVINYGLLVIIMIIIISRCGNENFENVRDFIQSPFINQTGRISLESEWKPAEIEGTKPCRPATLENPFGNPNLTDFGVPQEHSGVCRDTQTENVQNEVLNNGIFMDSNSYLWRRKQQDRQFHTVPGDTVPNDQTALAHWLFNDKNNCKAGNVFMRTPKLAENYLQNCKPDIREAQRFAAPFSSNIYSKLDPVSGIPILN